MAMMRATTCGLCVLILGLLTAPLYAQAFQWRSNVEVQAVDNGGSNIPVLVELTAANFDFSKANADGSDLRFGENDVPPADLPFYIENYDSTNETATIWVNVPSVPDEPDTVDVYIFYGDENLTSSASSFEDTFPNRYVSSGNDTLGGLQEFDWFEIQAGDVITVDAGNVLEIRAQRIIINGTINGNEAGFEGGEDEVDGDGPGGGEAGVWNGGTGDNAAGGGGAYGGDGGHGAFDDGADAGEGGSEYPDPVVPLEIQMGSGGGGGSIIGGAGFGGDGGGAIDLRGLVVEIDGEIFVNGGDGTGPASRAGGGGAGGGVIVGGYRISFSGQVEANGGDGGVGGGGTGAEYGGGGGGGGRVRFVYNDAHDLSGSVSVDGGSGGSSAGSPEFQAQDGQSGVENSGSPLQDSDIFDTVLSTVDPNEEQLPSPSLTVEYLDPAVEIEQGTDINIAVDTTVASLEFEISATDPDNLEIDIVTTITNLNGQGIDTSEWGTPSSTQDPVVTPLLGTFNEPQIHEVTITATNEIGLADQITFRIFVGAHLVVERDGNEIENGSFDILAQLVPDGGSVELTYDLVHRGEGTLTLEGDPIVEITGSTNATVTMLAQPEVSELDAQTDASFMLLVEPDSDGAFTVDILIEHDGLGSPYAFTLNGTAALTPRLTLTSPLDREVLAYDQHHVGYLRSYFAQSVTYTIENTGSTDLLLNDPTVTVRDAENVMVTITQPGSLVIGSGNSETFQLLLEPEPSGPFSFVLEIESNDPFDPVFTTYVEGWATTIPQSRPAIERLEGRMIANRSSHQAGLALTGTVAQYTFTVRNIGSETLELTAVEFSEPQNASVSVTQPGQLTLDYGETTTFTLEVTPDDPDLWQVRLDLLNESPMLPGYWIVVEGHAESSGDPQIVVSRQANQPIPFEGVEQIGAHAAGEMFGLSFRVRNVGTDALIVERPIELSQFENCTASVHRSPAMQIAPRVGVSPLVLHVTPDSSGVFSFDVLIRSNDPEHPEFTFTVSGNVPVTFPDGPSKFMGGCAATPQANTVFALLALTLLLLGILRRRPTSA